MAQNIYSLFWIDSEKLTDERQWAFYSEKLRSLPQSVTDLTLSPEAVYFFQDDIAAPFHLNEDQSAELTRIVKNILLGESYIGDMLKDIGSRLSLSPITAKEIATLILKSLLPGVLEDTKKIQAAKFSDRIKSARQSAPASQTNQEKDGESGGGNRVIDLRNNSK